MTLEEKAEKYANEKCKDCYMCSYSECKNPYEVCEKRQCRKQGYLAGAKENGVVWHDLRKDPNDLPRIGIRYLVFNKYGATLIGYWNGKYFVSADEDTVEIASPIAWCEIPQFKE